MKGKVVNFEAEYYLTKQKEARQALKNKEFEKVLELISEPLSKIEKLDDVEMYCPQNVFDQIIFLNLLGKEVHQTSFSKINYFDFYLMAASANYNLKNLQKSKDYYQKAIRLNPASCLARIYEMKIDFEIGCFDNYLNNLKDAMFFAYTRNDIGQIFELAGDYLSHEEDYEMAIVAYYLSMVYSVENISFEKAAALAKQHDIDIDGEDWLSDEYMKKFYNSYKIPLMPNEKIVMLAEAMGYDAYQNKAFDVSKFSFEIAYNLTLDDKYKKEIDELNSHK